MPNALKVKQFGLPRWVWLVALTGGVGVGLYIRAKRAQQDQSGTQVDTTSADPNAVAPTDPSNYDSSGGLPVGFYDAVSGASLPDAAGAGTTGAFDYAGFLQGLASLGIGAGQNTPQAITKIVRKGIPGPRGKPGKKGKPGKPSGPKGNVIGGGGPPKRPKPKVKAKPKPAKPKVTVASGGGGGHHSKKKR